MLLWCSSRSHCALLCCCGVAPARFVIHNVAGVQLLLVLQFATLLWSSSCLYLICLKLAMLLWSRSCSFCDLQHCCGEAPARFVIRNVAVGELLLTL